MAALTVDDVEARVRSIIRDSAGTFVTETMVIAWCNDAQTDISARLGYIETEASADMGDAGTSVANGTIDYPTGLVDVITLRLGEDDVEFVDYDTFYSWEDSGEDPDRTIAHSFNDKIYLYPKPASGDAYKLRYTTQPTALTAGANSLSVPIEQHPRIANFVIAMACYSSDDQGMGDRFMALYENGLPTPSTSKTRQHPGPLTLKRNLNIFDEDTDSAHR